MRKTVAFILLIIFAVGCNRKNTEQKNIVIDSITTEKDTLLSYNGHAVKLFEDYQIIDSTSNHLLFPLKVFNAKTSNESFTAYSKERGEGQLYWNIVFYNMATGESTLLAEDKKILLNRIIYEEKNIAQAKLILYEGFSDDSNTDKKLSTEDAKCLFVSNRYGENLIKISPENEHLLDWSFPKKNLLLITCKKDSNRDKVFDEKDEMTYYRIDLTDSLLMPKPLFSKEFKQNIKKQFNNHWKNNK